MRRTDNAGCTTRIGYDSRDNLTATSDGVGPLINSDPLDLFPGAINDAGNTVTRHYDGRDLMIREVYDLRVDGQGDGPLDTSNPFNPDGQITVQYVYDANSRHMALIDDNGNTTQYAYDALDRQISQTNADNTQHIYSYDRDSNQIEIVDPNGNRITNTFDTLNRTVRREIARAPGVVGTTEETYQYDGLSRLTTSSDNNGDSSRTHVTDHIFDSLSRQIEEQQDFEPISSVWAGDGKRLQLAYPTRRIFAYEYDPIDRIQRIIEPLPAILTRRHTVTSTTTTGVPVEPLTLIDYSWIGPDFCCCCCDCCECESRVLTQAYGDSTRMSLLNEAGDANIGYNNVKEVVALRHEAGNVAIVNRTYDYNRAYMRTQEILHDIIGAPMNTFALDSTYRIRSTDLGADGSPEGFSTRIGYPLMVLGIVKQSISPRYLGILQSILRTIISAMR